MPKPDSFGSLEAPCRGLIFTDLLALRPFEVFFLSREALPMPKINEPDDNHCTGRLLPISLFKINLNKDAGEAKKRGANAARGGGNHR